MKYKLVSDFSPSGDQPQAIKQLAEGIKRGDKSQTLLGVTGSGKTFTIANVIANLNRPTLVMSHNKTLAAQLYSEFKSFFPENAVEYFVSYYDYYQPEAFIPSTNTYIEKDLSINDELEKLRLSTTTQLLSGRRDVIVVSSVSCIYGIGNPDDFRKNVIKISVGQQVSRNLLLQDLVNSLYSRTEADFKPGNFRVKGDTVDIYPAYTDLAYRIIFWDDEIESIESFNPNDGYAISRNEQLIIYPTSIFVTSQDMVSQAVREIQIDLKERVDYFKEIGKPLEAKRIEDRVTYDVEMIKELGYCSGIENYSRYFDRRAPGTRPFCLLDFFPDDYITVIDESHVTIPQIRAMYGGDRSRKLNLVEYGFRLPAAIDNRPLKFEEFEELTNQFIFVSATPADYELEKSEGVVIEQVVRPTGLLDPVIEIRPCHNQVDDLLEEIEKVVGEGFRVLVTTLTKRLAEEMSKYLLRLNIRTRYIHSDVETLDRVEILNDLRGGEIDVLVGVNLLREGLDLPEVALVAILDADKEGFLRSERSLTQTAGRAARNLNGRVIFYADKITNSMQKTMDETQRRREKQIKYNIENNITPTTISKEIKTHLTNAVENKEREVRNYEIKSAESLAAEEQTWKYATKDKIQKEIKTLQKEMDKAVKELDFIAAAYLRDQIKEMKTYLD
ncbi:MAG: excinuclease ABC subunit UvrB [Bacteroidales bacterium]|nr:excinuclease ABC subunit UvrB [Bacteroidales bacterium]